MSINQDNTKLKNILGWSLKQANDIMKDKRSEILFSVDKLRKLQKRADSGKSSLSLQKKMLELKIYSAHLVQVECELKIAEIEEVLQKL